MHSFQTRWATITHQENLSYGCAYLIVGMCRLGASTPTIRKISIIPRGQALGVTLSTPETDRYNLRLDEVLAQIKVALGGRAAEKVIFDDLSTGASRTSRTSPRSHAAWSAAGA